jgi:hypothetical protein
LRLCKYAASAQGILDLMPEKLYEQARIGFLDPTQKTLVSFKIQEVVVIL